MVRKLLKQTVGIDVAHKKIDVSLGRMDETTATETYAFKTFENNEKGFASMLQWVRKNTEVTVALRFVMEATGVYHEKLAYFLSDKQHTVSIIMPNKITNFFRTLEVKTVTDKSMSVAIAQFGLEKNLDEWAAPNRVYRELRQLTRERDQIVAERTTVKNQLHAEKTEAYPNERTIARAKKRIKVLNDQEKEIKAEIAVRVKDNTEVNGSAKLITTIPGIGPLTAAIILAETDGFSLIRSKRQLASYAGFDIKEKESGTSVKGKPKISKRGNKHLRKAMHLPALAAIRYNERYKAKFIRIVSKTSIRMKGAVAVQRHLLEMAYTIFKTGKSFDPDYMLKQAKAKQDADDKKLEQLPTSCPKQADIKIA